MNSRFNQFDIECTIAAELWHCAPDAMRGNELIAKVLYDLPGTSFTEVLSCLWSAYAKGLVTRTSLGWYTGVIKAWREHHRN